MARCINYLLIQKNLVTVYAGVAKFEDWQDCLNDHTKKKSYDLISMIYRGSHDSKELVFSEVHVNRNRYYQIDPSHITGLEFECSSDFVKNFGNVVDSLETKTQLERLPLWLPYRFNLRESERGLSYQVLEISKLDVHRGKGGYSINYRDVRSVGIGIDERSINLLKMLKKDIEDDSDDDWLTLG